MLFPQKIKILQGARHPRVKYDAVPNTRHRQYDEEVNQATTFGRGFETIMDKTGICEIEISCL